MSFESAIMVLLLLVLIYLAIGVIFAITVVIKGVSSLDPAAKGSGWGFKMIIVPGMVAFWPLLWKKWKNREKP